LCFCQTGEYGFFFIGPLVLSLFLRTVSQHSLTR
jgi:hypothetical protein